MKITVCTTPIRPYPTDFPPFGSMAIIQALSKLPDVEVEFYNIDFHRPSFTDVKKYFEKNAIDVLGISAVVSTAYAYVKQLCQMIKEVSPKTKIIVGGNLAASAEILHRLCGVDYCVVGDGEKIITQLISFLKSENIDYAELKFIRGITFVYKDKFHFTGYGEKLSSDEIEEPDYKILEDDGSLDYFISNNVEERLFAYEGKVDQGKRVATVIMTKGCVARCTFCHRWERGFRVLPYDRLTNHIERLIKEYNVGFIQVADENFGSDAKATTRIVERLGELGLLWQVAGVRTSTVTKDMLQHWKKNGCLAVYYGIESGSQKILDIMEKKTTVEQNINALKWTGEVGLDTIIQLIIGMPGEDWNTINETFSFLTKVAPHITQWQDKTASDLISINYAQALPGTPLYEFGREHGLIGRTIEEEEKYLLGISDTDAYSDDHFVNMTDSPMLEVLTWRHILKARLDDFHYRLMSKDKVDLTLLQILIYYSHVLFNRVMRKLMKHRINKFAGDLKRDFVRDSGYFNVGGGLKFSPLLLNTYTSRLLFPSVASYIFIRLFLKKPLLALKIALDFLFIKTRLKRITLKSPNKSLRKVINIVSAGTEESSVGMLPLREGR